VNASLESRRATRLGPPGSRDQDARRPAPMHDPGIARPRTDDGARASSRASAEMVAVFYDTLRSLAASTLSRSASARSLPPTALVHEAWLRLGGEQMRRCRNRAHFFALASAVMRSILVDRARRRRAQRHGGGLVRVALDQVEVPDGTACDDQVLAVHDVLEKLAAEYPEKAELVKLRYFAGLSVAEAAEVLGVSEPTAHRWWLLARAWLSREIEL
jgi:RNA polymerase sigma factor (TIGR02999 family)